MAEKVRVHELAQELGVTSREVLARLKDLGEFVKSASSTVEAPTARRIRDLYTPRNDQLAGSSLPPRTSAASTRSQTRAIEPNRAARLPRTTRRAQLLAAAQDVFAANGYHAAAMDEIAERAGVSKPVLYQHFPGKLELYMALLETHIDELIERVTEAMESTTDNKRRVRNAVSAYFDFVDDESQAYRLMFESDLRGEPAVQAAIDRGTDVCVRAITATITADAGIDEERASLLAVGLVGISQVAARSWLVKNRSMAKEEAVALTSTLAWKGIGGGFPFQTASRTRLLHNELAQPDEHSGEHEFDELYLRALRGERCLVQRYSHDSGYQYDGALVPVSIYVEDSTNSHVVENAVLDLLRSSGMALDDVRPPIVGSWFRMMRTRPINATVADVITRLERAIEIQTLHRPQAEIDSSQVDAVAKLISALDKDPNAFVQIGSVFLIKVDGVVVVRNLSQRELAFLQRNSELLASPRSILRALEHFASQEATPEGNYSSHWARHSSATFGQRDSRIVREGDKVTVEHDSVKVTVCNPDDDGVVQITLDTGMGIASNYSVAFNSSNGVYRATAPTIGAIPVCVGPDGTAVLHNNRPTLMLKRPDTFPRELELLLDIGGGPANYVLEFAGIE